MTTTKTIAIIALGSQGDVQPYIALGVGLQRAGHAVRVVTHENFAPNVLAHGLGFCQMSGNVQEIAESPKMRELLAKGNFLAIMAYTTQEARRVALLWAKEGLEACTGADLIVVGVGGLFIGLALSEKLNVPLLQAHVFPFTPTQDFPGVLFAQNLGKLGGVVNRITHHVVRQIMWQASRGGDAAVRKDVLGLPATPFFGPYNSARLRQHPSVYGISPAVIVQPKDWHDARLVGYWFLDGGAGWSPPPELEAFLEAGPPPVFVGFGSMGSRDPEATAALVTEAVGKTQQRLVLQSGWGGLRPQDLPAHVFLAGQVPHTWLFGRMAAIVHHGGAGTTAASLRAGVPSIVVPFFGDQGFWGDRVYKLGVGPKPIARKRLGVDNLAHALTQALGDSAMQERAARLGATIRSEDGVGNAVALIETQLAKTH